MSHTFLSILVFLLRLTLVWSFPDIRLSYLKFLITGFFLCFLRTRVVRLENEGGDRGMCFKYNHLVVLVHLKLITRGGSLFVGLTYRNRNERKVKTGSGVNIGGPRRWTGFGGSSDSTVDVVIVLRINRRDKYENDGCQIRVVLLGKF